MQKSCVLSGSLLNRMRLNTCGAIQEHPVPFLLFAQPLKVGPNRTPIEKVKTETFSLFLSIDISSPSWASEHISQYPEEPVFYESVWDTHITLSTHRNKRTLVTWQRLQAQAAIKQREDKLNESVIVSMDETGRTGNSDDRCRCSNWLLFVFSPKYEKKRSLRETTTDRSCRENLWALTQDPPPKWLSESGVRSAPASHQSKWESAFWGQVCAEFDCFFLTLCSRYWG